MTIHRQYKDACECVNQSGNGLEGEEHTSFFEHVHTICKWYDQMNPIFGSKPSSFAVYTNEMDSNSDEDKEIDDEDECFFHDDIDNDSEEENKSDNESLQTVTERVQKKLSVDDSSSESSLSESKKQHRQTNKRNKGSKSKPAVIDIWAQTDNDNDLSTPGTTSSKSVFSKQRNKKSTKYQAKNKANTNGKRKEVVLASDARRSVRNKKSILNKNDKGLTNDSNDFEELIKLKKAALEEKKIHDSQKLLLEQKRILFDERRLEIEEKIFYGNIKKEIAQHNLEMLKMRKEAKDLKGDFDDEELNMMFPFRTE